MPTSAEFAVLDQLLINFAVDTYQELHQLLWEGVVELSDEVGSDGYTERYNDLSDYEDLLMDLGLTEGINLQTFWHSGIR